MKMKELDEVRLVKSMLFVGLDPGMAGFEQVKRLIKMIYESGERKKKNIKLIEYYKIVAKEYGLTKNSVERNTRSIILKAVRNKESFMNEMFYGLVYAGEILNSKTFILGFAMLLDVEDETGRKILQP